MLIDLSRIQTKNNNDSASGQQICPNDHVSGWNRRFTICLAICDPRNRWRVQNRITGDTVDNDNCCVWGRMFAKKWNLFIFLLKLLTLTVPRSCAEKIPSFRYCKTISIFTNPAINSWSLTVSFLILNWFLRTNFVFSHLVLPVVAII